jgi:hypothetical protein
MYKKQSPIRILFIIIFAIFVYACGDVKNEREKRIYTGKSNKYTKKKITNAKDLKFEKIITEQSEYAPEETLVIKDFLVLSGDSIRVRFNSDNKVAMLSIIEQRSGRILKKIKKTSDVNLDFRVNFENPYSIKIYFPKGTYYNLEISKKSSSISNYYSKSKLVRDSIIVDQKTKKSLIGKTLAYKKVFNEPKKFVVSNTFSFSGESKVYAPIEIPKNAVEFIYTLRISGYDQTLEEDGNLFNDLNTNSTKIKVFGLPLWESEEKGTSLSREILNSLFPPQKDEDYTLNVFFFDKQNELKKFVRYPGKAYASAFKYDINNSALSTQSRVGLIKKPKSGFSYIGLQSTSSFSNTYAWLDVVALYEKKFFYEIRYRIVK